VETNGNKPKVRQVAITRLKAGEQPFLAWGYSYLKGTEIVEDPDKPGKFIAEEVEFVVPIKSVGVSEVTDRIARKAPVAPMIRDRITPGSEDGKALGLTHPKMVDRENFTDETYKEELRKHQQRTVYAAVLAGLAMDVFDGDNLVVQANGHNQPTKILNEDRAIEILKEQGISNAQFDQLYADIQQLTTKERERVDQE
jgi:hypothetical protein